MEVTNDKERLQQDLDDLRSQNHKTTEQNSILIEQIKNFEQQSFEIQTKIKRGMEYENENKTHGQAISTMKDRERDLQRQIDQLNQ